MTPIPVTSRDWIIVVINGLLGVANQAALVLSLKFENASLVSLLRTFDIVVAFLYQIAFLEQPVYWTSILGSVIVCSGCVAVALKRYFSTERNQNQEATVQTQTQAE